MRSNGRLKQFLNEHGGMVMVGYAAFAGAIAVSVILALAAFGRALLALLAPGF
jgi:Flp pilus assembly pilin Flp